MVAGCSAAMTVRVGPYTFDEERRVLFVSVTRARRHCLVALPDDARGRGVAAACEEIGFVRVGD